MATKPIKKVVIAGGGTSGWIAAAALTKQLGKVLDIVLVESDDIGTIGVGEATIPPMRTFHKFLGIDEQEVMRATQATFKLGISFENWGQIGDKYIHSFGITGKDFYLGEFHDFWLHGLEKGIDAPFGDYCYELQAAKAGKFATSAKSKINYAYHMDATLYGRFLRKFSEDRGITRIEGKIVDVLKDQTTGGISAITLGSGQAIEGDLFIDCTGFRGLLIEKALHTGYEDWSHWLPCDSAVAVQTASTGPAVPYTRSIAHSAGWQWQIPLQHRVGNGLVFCSQYMSDEEAIKQLLDNIDGPPITKPKVIKYRTGRRRKNWNKNCIAMGLSSGFVEPLESTSIHLFMMATIRLMKLFPFGGITDEVIDEYNQQAAVELEKIRDFIILHYHVTQRDDSPFWRYCKDMEVPKTLSHRINLFKDGGRAFQSDGELFRVDSWVQVMLGQGIAPKQYHHMVKTMSDQELEKFLTGLKHSITSAVDQLPTHQEFVKHYCQAPEIKN
ncbi:tryptophan 7-halogenase [Psychrosphaera sp. B3R10]|uniref:tryptophan halogenase family protein n=1 Tax=unclassified Psychrosphaera TaxID=2641570 RepID=UPI001C08B642|nr:MULTISPECIES: tryptophan halogenase family protein [unclassified Psychrosphaera]MBU2883953.1 tryptophan 7-halogenase [Psychrosphaera sp. I2R16]MBU2990358.1 tryptophan 7-halogenase [Psychrosphaera sp. B3R10]